VRPIERAMQGRHLVQACFFTEMLSAENTIRCFFTEASIAHHLKWRS